MKVAYIVNDDERAAFQRLTSDAERERFIEQFWLRRDPNPATRANEIKEEHYRRIAHANFAGGMAGWKSDRGRIYIVHGPPDEIVAYPSDKREVWQYRRIPGIGERIHFEFSDPKLTGEYRLTAGPIAR